METNEDQSVWERCLKIRVAIDVNKPLKRGKMVSVLGGGSVLAMFRYERLPDFCYV